MRFEKVFVFLSLVLFFGCTGSNKVGESNTITIFHAGSLSKPLKAIADSFMVENPEVKVLLEAAGSVECARKITELGRECDLMFSADYKVIDELLIPEFASWNILFAGNELTLVYTPKSKFGNEINQQNWIEILLNPEVYFGRSDPNSDPCGYRTILTLKLAEQFYNSSGLTSSFEAKDNRFIRPKEVDLIALLETGAIDYVFLYRSVAIQHGLNYLRLPDEINLGSASMEEKYAAASLKIRGSSPGDTLLIVGEPMVYGFTMLNNAPSADLAKQFAEFFLEKEKGLKLIERSGMPVLSPLIVKNEKAVSTSVMKTVKKNE